MDSTLVKQFSVAKDISKAQDFYQKMINIIDKVLSKIADKMSNITVDDIRIFAMGEYTNNTFIDETGELEIVVSNSNPQMLLTNKTFKKQYAEAKNKKEKDKLSLKGTTHELVDLFFKEIVYYFGEETKLILTGQGIKILCKKEYDFNLMIRIGTFDQLDKEGTINFWNFITKSEEKFRLFDYNEAIEKKDKKSKGNLKSLIRILKNLRKTMITNKWISPSEINRYLVEYLAYNVPDKLLKGNDIVEVFAKSMLYLTNCSLNDYLDTDGEMLIYNRFANTDYAKIKKFLINANSILN